MERGSERRDKWIEQFIARLEQWRDAKDRRVLAILRRGANFQPETVQALYFLVQWLPRGEDEYARWREDNALLIASLFGVHPDAGGTKTLGHSFAELRKKTTADESLERNFNALLRSHRDDMPRRLRHAVKLLKGKDIPINWRQLLQDVLGWNHDSHYVQKKWAREFWRSHDATNQSASASGATTRTVK